MLKLKRVSVLFVLLINLGASAQNIKAVYRIDEEIIINGGNGNKSLSLSLTGHYYKSGNKYIYWESPDYLAKYPDGKVTISNDNVFNIYTVNADTIQKLYYHDYDSLIVRMGLFSEYQRPITEFRFEADASLPWVFETDTKVINGLKCQLATWSNQWRVWFCPDIPAKTSLHGLQGLPGLVVEADCPPTNAHYTLLNYDMPTMIQEAVFSPNVFNQPMVKGGLLKRKAIPVKTKQEKQAELLKQ